MTNYDSTDHLQATESTDSFGQTLLAAVVVLAATVGTVVFLSAPGVAVAFLAGALSAAGVHSVPTRRASTESSSLRETLASN